MQDMKKASTESCLERAGLEGTLASRVICPLKPLLYHQARPLINMIPCTQDEGPSHPQLRDPTQEMIIIINNNNNDDDDDDGSCH